MARTVRRFGPYFAVLVVLIGISALLVPAPKEATAATYVDPWWTNTSSNPECVACGGCGCPGPSIRSPEGVSFINGDLAKTFFLFDTPAMNGRNTFSLLWRSDISGRSQFGNGVIATWEWTLEPVDSTTKVLRAPSGLPETWTESGGVWSTSSCSVQETLTDLGSGVFERKDLQGSIWQFDANGMLDFYEDRNGNKFDPTYNSSYQMTGLTDDRSKSYTIVHNTDGFVESITDPSSRTWEFGYDNAGNLATIDTPATTDQIDGITTSIAYDVSNRMSSIEDGRNNTVYEYAWAGSTDQIDTVTIDNADVSFDYQSSITLRTDRNLNVHRAHITGNKITQTDMWVSGVAKYVTTYAYTGSVVATIVFPRLNRVDYTYNAYNEMTESRRKTTNTASTSASDLVETWAWTSHFATSHTDPEGHQTDITRDTAGNPTRVDFPDVKSPVAQTAYKAMTYNSYGQLLVTTDEEGKETRRAYLGAGDDFGLLQTIEVDPSGLDLETTLGYDSYWNVDSVTDPRGNATTSTWDTLRRLKQRTSPSPLSIDKRWWYDGNGNVTKHEVENLDKDGDSDTANPWITTTYTHSNEDQLLTIVGEIDPSTTRTTTFTHDGNGNRVGVIKPEGNKDKWTFNERDFVASHVKGFTSVDEATIEYTYDDNGNRTVVKDGRLNSTTTTYDLFDRGYKVTDPLGHYSEVEFDKRGRVTKEMRKNSSATELARRSIYYDERGRLWKTSDLHKDPGTTYSDAVTQIERFKTGHVKTVTDARNKDTDYAYDNAWRRTQVTDSMGNDSEWALDDNGNATSWTISEKDGASTIAHDFEATYDVLNRRLTHVEVDRITTTNKLTTTYGHDSRGNLVWQKNAEGDPTRWTFDAAGRMRMREVALTTGTTIEDFTTAIVTQWGFDKNDRLTSHKDDSANTSTWTHDALDRVAELKYPDLKKITYVHDDADNVTKTTDAAGNVIDDVYDSNDRRTSRTVTRATGFLGTTSETFSYDGLGRMTEASDNDYKVEFTHGVIGLSSQVYEEKQSFVGQTAYLRTVRKTYDEVGNKVAELYPSNLDLDYTWNDINQLATVTDGTNTIASYSYIGMRRKSVTFQSGATASYSYTGFRGEVERIHHETSNPATIVDLQYGYNDNHDRLYERLGASGQAGDAYAYDMARRLTTAWMGSATPSDPTSAAYVKKIEYDMDDDGNRSSVVVTPYQQGSSTTSYTDNSLNQYTAVGGTGQSHDDNGNLVDDGTLDFEYDYKNQIVRVKQSSTTIAEYKYDALGRRVEKDDQTTTHRYIYSGDETVSVYGATDVFIRNFVFGAVIDEVLMLQQADLLDFDSDSDTNETTRSFYHRNALGSVMEITDMNEAEVASYRYAPYGAVTITRGGSPESSDPLGQPWMYTGRFTDEETGRYYYRARYYSPETGRFMQRHPLGYAPGANVYEYARQSPADLRDPLGEQPTRDQQIDRYPIFVSVSGLGSLLIGNDDRFQDADLLFFKPVKKTGCKHSCYGSFTTQEFDPLATGGERVWGRDGKLTASGRRAASFCLSTARMIAQMRAHKRCATLNRGKKCKCTFDPDRGQSWTNSTYLRVRGGGRMVGAICGVTVRGTCTPG